MSDIDEAKSDETISDEASSDHEKPNLQILVEEHPEYKPSINLKDLTAKAIYSNMKKNSKKPPSFNNSSDFLEESSTSQSSEPSASIQLIKVTSKGLEICEEGAKYLKKLKEKVGVISIGGPARSGKSLLLNLLTKQTTFEVGSRIQACTQGV